MNISSYCNAWNWEQHRCSVYSDDDDREDTVFEACIYCICCKEHSYNVYSSQRKAARAKRSVRYCDACHAYAVAEKTTKVSLMDFLGTSHEKPVRPTHVYTYTLNGVVFNTAKTMRETLGPNSAPEDSCDSYDSDDSCGAKEDEFAFNQPTKSPRVRYSKNRV